ncbi:hypothetical protein K450DRAFT_248741 [Umbelopsis ramanniana AG]|uniref:Uncharacterized protein n=1 Tax=Umbelopsis ramanniana AG TaxID=1314678 RepID=A0AAD5HCL9_UMBRA|nr:uncharacterized protein K450DRAFT_248741 [Umbelopsis ramanniana AG]KAI8578039.1 hypothetical protein K450DRAFT_248741 [Umbelopsis ramanniana AG]
MDSLGHPRRLQNSFPKPSPIIPYTHTYCPIQRRTTPPITTSDRRLTPQTCHRTSPGVGISQLLQPNVPLSQEEWRFPLRLQPAIFEPICRVPTFQDGKYPTSNQTDQSGRLFHLSGSFRCVSTHPDTQTVSEVPSFPLGRTHLSISDHPLWSLRRSLAIHSSHQTDSSIGTTTGHTDIRLPGRLDSGRRISGISSVPNLSASDPTEESWMDHQYTLFYLSDPAKCLPRQIAVPRTRAMPVLMGRMSRQTVMATEDAESPQKYQKRKKKLPLFLLPRKLSLSTLLKTTASASRTTSFSLHSSTFPSPLVLSQNNVNCSAWPNKDNVEKLIA